MLSRNAVTKWQPSPSHGRRRRTRRVAPAAARGQLGMSLVMVSVVIAVLSLALIGLTRMQIRTANERAGLAAGSAIASISDAVNAYRTTNMGTLTATVTPVIPGFAAPMAPTVAELQAAGYLSTNVAATLGEAGAYNIALFREPAGCSGPTGCTIWSRLHLTNPIVDLESGNPDVNKLGALISRVGDAASYSAQPNPGTITGGNGSWSIANPDAASRAGIVVVVAGLGGANEPWLRVQDTRNPDFRGPSVTGTQFNTANQTVGGACTINGAFATAAQGIVFCSNNVWVLHNAQIATGATACTDEGVMGMTNTGASLICLSGLWRDHATYGMRGFVYATHNQMLAPPTCGAGLTPRAVVAGVSASVIIGANNPGNNTGSWQAEINPTTWLVRIIGADDSQAGTNARALIQAFCALA